MKIQYWITTLYLTFSFNLFAQDIRLNRNFVITINNKVEVASLNNLQLIINRGDTKTQTIQIGYIPGELYFASEAEKEKFYSDTANNILLRLNYNEYKRGKQVIYNYEIKLNKKWLEYSFIVLRIYNLDLRKSGANKGVNYSYGFDFPAYSILPVK